VNIRKLFAIIFWPCYLLADAEWDQMTKMVAVAPEPVNSALNTSTSGA
jgi:hypothetical protein